MHKDYHFLTLLSGIDSFVATCLYQESGKNGLALVFDYGQSESEIKTTEKLANILGLTLEIAKLDIDILRIGDAPFYPFRNAIFLTTAANWVLTRTDAQTIITGLGTISSSELEAYPDTSAVFIGNLMCAINAGVPDENQVSILSPVSMWTKKEIFDWLVKNDYDEIIPITTSCYEDEPRTYTWGVGCGLCAHCTAREADFKASLANPANYKNNRKDLKNGRATNHARTTSKRFFKN